MISQFFVYILRCADDSYYVGHTDNLEQRLFEHAIRKFSGYTSTRLPVVLLFYQRFDLREDAFTAERKIKGWNRLKKEALIKNGWKGLIELCKK
ncbi:TPA: GIY-YIG nuclease family protein [Candidatus Dependentiae bacterium]|nr:MAG: excinuclease ABC subunit C [candidate division TM6 bacterium GW2011_GWF2_36_131]KKQ03321.1 MAG: excinuclease ABC subunit C [candidate division TM6 bacterium GW2011_GWE2_36_25]KKQ19717.1 MAG: excinuclease ABC subunit C [candidate division TM6 bacterium GW2011_GWA2_36_9]HBR70900.1 GIY-YIG nuclease family protein [Candidatus Dependentiae bacterium]HCU00497.1 GIY-YIG nuclease family protein [Candidatus Dependentiae bacterium]